MRSTVPNGSGIVMDIDATDLILVAKDIQKVAAMTPRALEVNLTRAANARLHLLEDLAPYQWRPDLRHPVHLDRSFSVIKPARGVRQIVTSTPDKLRWVTEGTGWGGTYGINPRHPKDALWWPGMTNGGHPVAHVEHPSTAAYPFVDMVQEAFDTYMPVVSVNAIYAGVGGGRGAGTGGRKGRTSTPRAGSGGSGKGTKAVRPQPSDTGILMNLLDQILVGFMGGLGAISAVAGMVASAIGEAFTMAEE